MTDEINNYLDALNKEHSDFIQKWIETNDKSELDEYISHLTDEEKDALFILLIMKFTNSFDGGMANGDKSSSMF